MIETGIQIPIIASILVYAILYYIGYFDSISHKIIFSGACMSGTFAWITYMNSFLSWQLIGISVFVYITVTAIIATIFDCRCHENSMKKKMKPQKGEQ